MSLAQKLSTRRRSSPSFREVEEITFDATPKITLKNQGLSMRSDHLKALRYLSIDLELDDYKFSASEVARCAVAMFLLLPLKDQVRWLERYQKEERRAMRKAR